MTKAKRLVSHDYFDMAKITINGEVKEVEITLLSDLLNGLKLNAPYFAVAINDSVVPRSKHEIGRAHV